MPKLAANVRRSTRLARESVTTVVPTENLGTQRPTKKAKAEQLNRVEHALSGTTAHTPTNSAQKVKKGQQSLDPKDYPPRASNLWKVGAHVSAAGGVENAVLNAAAVGANAFGLFLKSQRKWTSPPLSDDSIAAFKSRLESFGYLPSHVLPHGSYLINLGNPDKEKRDKSYDCFLDDLRRCEQLGIPLYNFHPGSTVGATTRETSISLIAECLNRAHKETDFVVTLIENMAGAGNIVGSSFDDLANILRQVDDKQRVGVCLDTCHMFAAGYDIRTAEGWNTTMVDFDTKVGLSFLRGMHINDSKAELASKKDRHENIGLGQLGLATFAHILSDPRMQGIPLILETPSFEVNEIWGKEIDVLHRVTVTEEEGLEQLLEEIKEVVGRHAKAAGSTKVKKGEV